MRGTDIETLAKLRNVIAGRTPERPRAFVMGTGRSLLAIRADDWELLRGETVIALNYLARWRSLPVEPAVWVMNNPGDFSGIRDLVTRRSGVKLFVAHEPTQDQLRAVDWTWVERDPARMLVMGDIPAFIAHPEAGFRPFTFGSTVIWDGIQLACWMGAREVYLLGIDADSSGQVWYPSPEPSDAQARRTEVKVDAMADAWNALTSWGRVLVNATPGRSKLTIPHADLGNVLRGGFPVRIVPSTLGTVTSSTASSATIVFTEVSTSLSKAKTGKVRKPVTKKKPAAKSKPSTVKPVSRPAPIPTPPVPTPTPIPVKTTVPKTSKGPKTVAKVPVMPKTEVLRRVRKVAKPVKRKRAAKKKR
jgi:hypothetical protein